MRRHMMMAGLALVAVAARDVPSPAVAAALADPARGEQRADDARRQAGAVLAFAGVKPGDTAIDFLPGRFYWTRLLSDVVGAQGRVVAESPGFADPAKPAAALAGWPRANVSFALPPGAAGATPQPPADLFLTVQNYHDVANVKDGGDPAAALLRFDRAVFAALKPGGTYLVIDHAAAAGSGLRDTGTLHRIDPAAVKAEVVAAGFRFDGESLVLANPADDHGAKVFDPAIRGRTDQFVYRFRKPR